MTPQQIIPSGNNIIDSFLACVASVLGVSVEDFRHSSHCGSAARAQVKAAASSFGLCLLHFDWESTGRSIQLDNPELYSIVKGQTCQGYGRGWVVYKGSRQVHDPDERQLPFIGPPLDMYVFVALDPEKCRRD